MGINNNPKLRPLIMSKDNLSLFNNNAAQPIRVINPDTAKHMPPYLFPLYHIPLSDSVFLSLNPYKQFGGILLIIKGIEMIMNSKADKIDEIIGLSFGSIITLIFLGRTGFKCIAGFKSQREYVRKRNIAQPAITD